MNKTNYDLNNPMERARAIKDSIMFFRQQETVLLCPAALSYKFNDSIEALSFVFYHTAEVDNRDVYIEAYLDQVGMYIRTSYGSYHLKRLSDFTYKYRPSEDEQFKIDTEKKIQLMEKEFNTRFSKQELESQMNHQALAIVNNGFIHTQIEDKLEHFLNQYFQGRWIEYTVESRQLDKISTQYTLKVKYDAGVFEIAKPSKLLCKSNK